MREAISLSDLDQVQSAGVGLRLDRQQRMGQQLEENPLALRLEQRTGLIQLPPDHMKTTVRSKRNTPQLCRMSTTDLKSTGTGCNLQRWCKVIKYMYLIQV